MGGKAFSTEKKDNRGRGAGKAEINGERERE